MTAWVILGVLVAAALLGPTCAWMLWVCRQRTYRYAVMMADRFDVTDPVGQAYSDMATAIALDGWVSVPNRVGRCDEPLPWSDPRSDPLQDMADVAGAPVAGRTPRQATAADEVLCPRSGTYLDDTLGDRYRGGGTGSGESTCGRCGAHLRTFTKTNEAVRIPNHPPASP